MNWEAIGAVAELVAAIAVLPTLLYLAIQLRQNTRSLKSATIDSLNSSMADNARSIVENDAIIELLAKVGSNQPLSSTEATRLHFLLVMLVRRFEGFYFQNALGFVDDHMTGGYERSILSIIASNGEWWVSAKSLYSPEFSAYVDRQLQSGEWAPLHPGFSGSS